MARARSSRSARRTPSPRSTLRRSRYPRRFRPVEIPTVLRGRCADKRALRTPEHERAVLGTEAEAVADSGLDVGPASAMRNEIQIARRVGMVQVDGRGQKL